jgi:hypothetical protein
LQYPYGDMEVSRRRAEQPAEQVQEVEGEAPSEVSEAPEEARERALPSYTVTFCGEGVEVTCQEMNAVPLVMIERAQHLVFRQVMIERQKAARAVPQSREAGWDNSYERKVNAT